MSKWYEVQIISRIVYAVEVEDDEGKDNAMDYAFMHCDAENIEVECSHEIIGDGEIYRLKRHANKVLTTEEPA